MDELQIGPVTLTAGDYIHSHWNIGFDGGELLLIGYRKGDIWYSIGRHRTYGNRNQAGSKSFDPFDCDDKKIWFTGFAASAEDLDAKFQAVVNSMEAVFPVKVKRVPVEGGIAKYAKIVMEQEDTHWARDNRMPKGECGFNVAVPSTEIN